MSISDSIIFFTAAIFSLECIFLGLLILFIRDKQERSTAILAFFLLCMGLDTGLDVLRYNGIDVRYSPFEFEMLYAPLIYLYTRYLLKVKTTWRLWWILCPATFIFLGNLIALLVGAEHLGFIELVISGALLPLDVFAFCFEGILFYFSFRLIQLQEKYFLAQFLTIREVQLNWLKTFIGFAFFLYLFFNVLLFSEVFNFFKLEEIWQLTSLFCAVYIVMVFMITYYGIQYPVILKGHLDADELKDKNETAPSLTYEKSALSESVLKEIYQRCVNFLESPDHPFKRADLSLSDVANAIGQPVAYVSQAITKCSPFTNFYHLINHYRVAEVKKQLADDQNRHFTLVAIAEHCGFQHKSTFIRAFKLLEGVSPSEYRKKIEHQKVSPN